MTKKARALLIARFAEMSIDDLNWAKDLANQELERYQAPSYTAKRENARELLAMIDAELASRETVSFADLQQSWIARISATPAGPERVAMLATAKRELEIAKNNEYAARRAA